jgi:hypothetical protein
MLLPLARPQFTDSPPRQRMRGPGTSFPFLLSLAGETFLLSEEQLSLPLVFPSG